MAGRAGAPEISEGSEPAVGVAESEGVGWVGAPWAKDSNGRAVGLVDLREKVREVAAPEGAAAAEEDCC